jgi:hypothetical protein
MSFILRRVPFILLLAPVFLLAISMGSYAENGFDEFASEPIVGEEETVEAAPDPIKEALLNIFAQVQGSGGDVVVFGAVVLMALAIWKKMYRASVGMLVLLIGVVIIRVIISALFL